MLLSMNILFASRGDKNRRVFVFLWIGYALVTALLTWNHAPWRDEANVWLIAREVSWLNIYREAGMHNSPSLWYYLLAVPAKLGLPYGSMQSLHWLVACLAIGIFLFSAPFSILFKALFIFSFYITYEYAVLARVYMPTILLIWSACGFYSKRYQRPILYAFIIALLAHTSFFGILAAIFFAIDFFLSRWRIFTPRQWGAIVIVVLAVLLSVSGIVFNRDFLSYCSDVCFKMNNIWDTLYFTYLAPNADYYFPDGIKGMLRFISPLLGALYGMLTIWLLIRWRAYCLTVFLVLSWMVIIYFVSFKYPWPSPRHYGFCLIYTITVLWLGKVRFREAKAMIEPLLGILLAVSFLLGVLGTVAQGYRDAALPFSGGKGMADYLREYKLEDKSFVTDDAMSAVSILPYMPKASLWSPITLGSFRNIHVDRYLFKYLTMKKVLRRTRKKFGSFERPYLISSKCVAAEDAQRLKLLYFADGQTEKLWLYRVTY